MSIPFDKDAIKEAIEYNQVEQFLADHGGEPVRRIGTLVSRTICHNPPDAKDYKLGHGGHSGKE